MLFKKTSKCLIIVLILVSIFSLSVFAEETSLVPVESEMMGSITIQLEDTEENLSKEDVHMKVVKIAEVKNGKFVLYDGYESIKLDLNNIRNSNELVDLADELEEKRPEGTELVTNQDGAAIITDLSVGVYFVYGTDTASYEEISPTLISIPSWNELEGKMIYDVKIMPKHAPIPKAETPPTGDQNQILKHIMVSVAAIMVGGGCFYIKRKKM